MARFKVVDETRVNLTYTRRYGRALGNLNVEQRLSNGRNITLAYDGRKASGLNTVHTGRMPVAVLF